MTNSERNLQAVHLPEQWSPESWRARPAMQLPVYPDAAELAGVQAELRSLPPIVTSWEILALKQQLAEAQEGRRFLCSCTACACRSCAWVASPGSTPNRARSTRKRSTG
jgi:3-deoxy-7-phosphoheptulonate synthase